MSFQERYGPWAFIAGASMGIGAALSHVQVPPWSTDFAIDAAGALL